MKSTRTRGCHVGLFREFVGTACCTYGKSNTTNETFTEQITSGVWCRQFFVCEIKFVVKLIMSPPLHTFDNVAK